jgi:DNA-binding response OmpR family regulator
MDKKILIVDDDTDITLLLKNGLEDNGYFADSYNDPRLALKNFKADYYNLMLVDIQMPNMNGFEFYHEVRKSDIKIRVCFLTAFPISFEEIRKVLPPELINRQYIIQKPITITELTKRINEMLR